MKQLDDAFEMAELFQQGERKGFDFFFNQIYPSVLYFSYRITNDTFVSEDCVENAFIKLWKNHKRFSHPMVIKSWLYTVVKNESLNALIRNKRRIKMETAYYESRAGEVERPHHEIMSGAEIASGIEKWLTILPPMCRNIIQLYYFGDLNTTEIAIELGISPSTVKNQKVIGEKMIKRFIETGYRIPNEEEKKTRWIEVATCGLRYKEAAKKFGISEDTVYDIRRKYKSGKFNKQNLAVHIP